MTTGSFYFDTEIKEIKITKQISNWMRILETGCKCQTAEGIILWKHLPAAIRYQDTLLTSPLIFCSASILCSSLSLSCFDFSWIYLETGTLLLKNIKRASRTDCKLFLFIQHSCRNGPCLSESRQGSRFSDIKFFTSYLSVYSMWCLFEGVIYL